MSEINFVNKFTGYQNYMDITNMPITSLAPGSQNVFIEDGSKLEPRAGMAYFGAPGTQGVQTDPYWTLAHRIHSKYDDFVNKQGIKIPIRVYYSGNTDEGDVMQVWLPTFIAGIPQEIKQWYTITSSSPGIPIISKHRFYWAEWHDAQSPVVLTKQSEIIFTYGDTKIGNWSGGFAPVISKTGTTLTTDDIWTTKGFIAAPEGINTVVINGIEYTVSGGFNTNTITISDTSNISINDLVFQSVYFEDKLSNDVTYDVCSTINNQVYYLDWNDRTVYISWDRNQTQNFGNTIFIGLGLNDGIYSGTYTGTLDTLYKVSISKIAPAQVRTYGPAGSDTVGDNGVFVGNHTGTNRDTYTVVISTPGPTQSANWFLNGVLGGSFLTSAATIGSPISLGNGISFYINGDTSTHQVNTGWVLEVGGVDSFQWGINGQTPLSSDITITGSTQNLSNGVRIKFDSTNGHTVGDSWTVTAYPTIIRGWSDFSYTNPNRRPGQGFTIGLDSNGWTMQPQESRMLINAQAGHYYDVELKLSSDLLTETVTRNRLKSEPENKVLFPYLIGYVKNQSAIISNEKTYDILGRQKFLELQQLKTLSDVVRIDFETVDWEDADILYYKRKIFFNVPRTTEDGKGACIFVWDDYRKYWHTPQVFGKRISLLSVIDNVLVGHSYEQNESYELFTGLNDLGIFPIATKMVFPYNSGSDRYDEKSTDAIGFEGYILGNPDIKYIINADVGGCGGQQKGSILPWNTSKGVCLPSDKSSLGKSPLGYHGLGNDPVDVIPHFFYIKMFDNMQYYQRNIEIICDSLEQRWSLISIGTSINTNNINSESITDRT